ncbi:2-dehydropantoate 2-reductase [Monosporozyma servazzii]
MTLTTKPVIHIVGMGSMGTLLAVNLLQFSNTEVIPLFRNKERLSQFQKDAASTIGIRKLFEKDTPLITKRVENSFCPTDFPGTHIQNLVITTKTYQTKSALQPYLPYIDSDTNLILIQNGLGVLEVLREDIFTKADNRPNLFQGVISHGCFQDEGFIYNHAGFADIKIARLPWSQEDLVQTNDSVVNDSSENSLVKILTEPTFAKEFNSKIMTYQEMLFGQLFKFLINACINPVTATLDCDNGEMVDSCRPIFVSIIEEGLSILRVAYKPLFEYENKYNSMDDYPSLNVNSVLNVDHLVNEIIHIGCVVNAKNSSSMRQDTRYLRETEIDYINGYLVNLAHDLGLSPDSAKVNKTISELVKLRLGLNRKRASEGEWKFK